MVVGSNDRGGGDGGRRSGSHNVCMLVAMTTTCTMVVVALVPTMMWQEVVTGIFATVTIDRCTISGCVGQWWWQWQGQQLQ